MHPEAQRYFDAMFGNGSALDELADEIAACEEIRAQRDRAHGGAESPRCSRVHAAIEFKSGVRTALFLCIRCDWISKSASEAHGSDEERGPGPVLSHIGYPRRRAWDVYAVALVPLQWRSPFIAWKAGGSAHRRARDIWTERENRIEGRATKPNQHTGVVVETTSRTFQGKPVPAAVCLICSWVAEPSTWVDSEIQRIEMGAQALDHSEDPEAHFPLVRLCAAPRATYDVAAFKG